MGKIGIENMEKFILSRGVALMVSDSGGELPALLLLHGYLSSGDVFDELSAKLKKEYRVVSLDLPGAGISEVVGEVHTMEWMADVAIGVLEQCGIERATVVGHSMGGYVALEMVRARPEMVDRLVLMHALPTADSPEKQSERERELKVLSEGKKDILAHIAPEHSFAPQNRKRMAEEMESMAERIIITEDEGAMAQLRGLLARGDQSSILKESAVPLTFILGRHDERVSAECAEAVVAEYPSAEVVWLEESGHFGFLEEPERVVEVLIGKRIV